MLSYAGASKQGRDDTAQPLVLGLHLRSWAIWPFASHSPPPSRPFVSKAAVHALGTALLGVLILGACANNVFYDETRDKQSQAAKKAVADAKISDAIANLQTTFNDLAKQEEDHARNRVKQLFDFEISVVSRAPSLASTAQSDAGVNGLLTTVNARLTRLGLKAATQEGIKSLRTLEVKRNAKLRALEQTQIEFHGAVGHKFASCAEVYSASADPEHKGTLPSKQLLKTIPADRHALAQVKFDALVTDCKALDKVDQDRATLIDETGEIASLSKRLNAVERDIAAYDVAKQLAKADLDAATKDFRTLSAGTAKAAGPSRSETLSQRTATLQHVVDVIGAADSVFGLAGAQVVAEERLAHLEIVVGALAGTPSGDAVKLSTDEQVAIAVVRDLPALADEADKLLNNARKPRLVPFLAAMEQEQLVVHGYEARQEAMRKQVTAARNQVQAALGEAVALARIKQLLEKDPTWATQSIDQLNRTLSGKDKRDFYTALALYADNVQQYRIDVAVWRSRELAAQYEEGLTRSKYAAAQWDSLLNTIASVLAEYHAAGIKQSDLAEFLKAFGLVVIGIGVAQ